jgi:dipeptidyl aminopeptidase/acylaminoacyl peptidase
VCKDAQWLRNYPLTFADPMRARYKLRLEFQDYKDSPLRHLLLALIAVMALDVLPSTALAEAEAFARMPTFADIEISPDGHYFAARFNSKNKYVVGVFAIVGNEIKYVYGFEESETLSVNWFEWASSERLLVSTGFTGRRRARGVVQTSETRLVFLDVTTNEVTALFKPKKGERPVQIQDNIVSFLPSDPDHMLLQYPLADPSQPSVFRVNLNKPTRHSLVVGAHRGVLSWMADHDGDVRLGSGVRNDSKAHLEVRKKGEKKWLDLSHRVNVDNLSFRPLGFADQPNLLYVMSNHEGDPSGLYYFDIAADQFGSLIYKHPTVDISSVRIDGATGELLSVNFVDDDVATKRFLERPIEKEIDRNRERFPNHNLLTHTISQNGHHAVLSITSVNDAGTYMLYSEAGDRIISLPPQYPKIAAETLGNTFGAEYVARDGLTIPAYITLPAQYKSLEEASELPFVIHPHGGPGSRDFLRFSFDVQFMTSLGYGVLQMNFRGSTGYGQAFQDAGDRQWGQAMQDDVTDGVHWLIENGFADADRIAIAGGSYGGYVALMGAVKTPDLYQCAISFAGVTDLPDLLSHEKNFVAGTYRTRFIGNLWTDREMLAANSPARRADEIKIPILLMHGDLDTTVDIDQSENMAKELRKHDKQYSFITFENGDHHLSLYDNRLRYLQETESFLNDCLN